MPFRNGGGRPASSIPSVAQSIRTLVPSPLGVPELPAPGVPDDLLEIGVGRTPFKPLAPKHGIRHLPGGHAFPTSPHAQRTRRPSAVTGRLRTFMHGEPLPGPRAVDCTFSTAGTAPHRQPTSVPKPPTSD